MTPDKTGVLDGQVVWETVQGFERRKLGGQVRMDVFGPAAQKISVAYNSPFDVALGQPVKDEIKNVGVLGKDPEQAWSDAMSTCRRIAKHLGVSY